MNTTMSMFLALVVLLGLIAFLVWGGTFIRETVAIRVINNTHRFIQNIDVTAYPSHGKKAYPFYVDPLPSERDASIIVWHFKHGKIRLQYPDEAGGTTCGVIAHTVCPWTRNDIIYLEPDGKIVPVAPLCRSKSSRQPDQLIVRPCEEQAFQVKPGLIMSNWRKWFIRMAYLKAGQVYRPG